MVALKNVAKHCNFWPLADANQYNFLEPSLGSITRPGSMGIISAYS